jgi:serine protease
MNKNRRRSWLSLSAFLALLMTPLASQAVWNDRGEHPQVVHTDQMIVQRVLSDLGVTAGQVNNWSQAAGVNLMLWRTAANGALVLKLPVPLPLQEILGMAKRILATDPSLAYAEPDYIVTPALEPNDPLYNQDQYFVQWHYFELAGGVNLPAAWDRTLGDPNLTVAVLDTGIRPHADLNGRYTPYVAGQTSPGAAGYDFVGNLLRANDGDGRDPDPSDPGD